MDHTAELVRQVLTDILNLGARGDTMALASPLLGSLPELDSMAVVNVITALEDRFGISIDYEDINARTFASLGTLASMIRQRIENDAA